MRKRFLISIFFALFFIHANGQTEDAALWVPQKMITGETYEGVVILDTASSSGQTVVLSSSDPSVLSVSESALVLPYQNHGMFRISALREGTADVFALVEGKMTKLQATVYSSSTVPTALSVLLPANVTKADSMIGYVLSVDARGTPAPVLEDTYVTLSSTPMIRVEDKVQIKQGSHYSRFFAHIIGSGKIFASAPGLELGQTQVSRLQDDATVRIRVAPDIMLEDSRAYFYVWLEKDGRSFKPPHVVHAFLSSNNLDSVRFSENAHIKQHSDSVLRIPLVDGVGSGTLVSVGRGSAVITANVEGFGSAQTSVVVGPVLIDENFRFAEVESKDKIKEISDRRPNVAFVWAYPSVTDSKAFGIVGLYNMNVTKNTRTYVDSNGTSVVITSSINRVEPVPLDGRELTVTSSGLVHPSVISLSESNEVLLSRGSGFNHAVEFPISGSTQGNHTISVAGPGLERFQTTLQVGPPYTESYQIKVVPIPSLPNSEQDLAMISVFDAHNALVDMQKAFSGIPEMHVSSTLDGKKKTGGGKNSVILAGSLNGATHITVSADGFGPHQGVLSPSGIADAISLDVPQRIHVLEQAPYVVHEVDSYGTPLKRINFTDVSATPDLAVSGGRITISDTGVEDLAVLSRLGADNKKIEAFANQMSLQITSNGTTNRVNKDFELTVNADVQDMQIIVDAPFPYKKISDRTFVVTPNMEGHFNITFMGLKDGYVPARSSFAVYAEKIFTVFFNAVDSTKNELHVNTLVEIDGVAKSLVTPYQYELRPQFLDVEFPEVFESGQIGYRLERVEFGKNRISTGIIDRIYVDSDIAITAQYQKMVWIQAENAVGSGHYPYGSTVTLSVPPKDKVSFFVREVFDRWEGITYDSEAVTFVATENIDARAVLRDDYSFLMLICGTGLTAIVYFRFVWKRRLRPDWYMCRLFGKMRIPKIFSMPELRKKPTKIQNPESSNGGKKEIDF